MSIHIERVKRIRNELKSCGWIIRSSQLIGAFFIEHPATVRKIKFWPKSEKWLEVSCMMPPGSMMLASHDGVARGVGTESLIAHARGNIGLAAVHATR